MTTADTGEIDLRRSATARREALRDLRELLAIVGKPRWATPVLILLGLASSLAETLGITLILLFLYLATGQTGDAGIGPTGDLIETAAAWFGDTRTLAPFILVMILMRTALALIYRRISAEVSEAISETARNLIHERYLTLSYADIGKYDQTQLMEVLGSESWTIAGAYFSLTRLIINMCSIAVFAVFLIVISWQIAVVAAIGSVVITVCLRYLSRPARGLGVRVKSTHQRLAEQMLMTLQSMRTIRAYGDEIRHQQRFVTMSREARNISRALRHQSGWIGPSTEVGYLVILLVIVMLAEGWGIGFSATLTAVVLLYRLQPHALEFESNLLSLAQIQPQLQSLRAMLDLSGKSLVDPGTLPVTQIRDEIRFDHVRFAYEADGTPVLDDVSFTIPAGKTTAIIGASGTGKTTIVNLLLRLYAPRSGEIRVDGAPLQQLKRSDWLRLIGVAGQDVELIEGTVRENIRMFQDEVDAARIEEVARIAGVSEFIDPLPDDYDTWVGQEGLRFSGGQRQRIGIARALLRAPSFMILDEATSALDQGLEDRVRSEVARRMQGRTVLIITHRLETVRGADHAIWIDGGQVRATGAAAEVLAAHQADRDGLRRARQLS